MTNYCIINVWSASGGKAHVSGHRYDSASASDVGVRVFLHGRHAGGRDFDWANNRLDE
ncbi:hypothetical protein IF1G_00250 [Cordyceps javanica]|uniref:Uncharacterized protein n=1 Tax=Cordyceps javanica TaxID=43265 RepID=A0A545VF21_9HYPO|nr:hypothetical protein IF1G_00250 [Cordyceps javanica]